MSNTVSIGGQELSAAYGVEVTAVRISPPEAKTIYVDVPGMDGQLDMTEMFGYVRYNPREVVIEGILRGSYAAYSAALTALANAVDGQRLPMALGWDAGYQYQGRWAVESEKQDAYSAAVTITGVCDPYKYKVPVTTATFSVATTQAVTLENGRMPVAPTVTTDAEMQVVFGGATYTFSAGTRIAPGLILAEGENALTVNGTGSITFQYQEGDL